MAVTREVSAYEVGGIDVNQLALALAERLKPVEVELPMFGELADAWLNFIRPKRVAPSNEERLVRRLVPLFLDDEKSLTAAAIMELLEAQTDLSPSTKNKMLGAGRQIVDWAAARQQWTRPNPFRLVRRQKEQERQYELLSLEELYALQPHLRPDRLRMFRVALHLGLRPGELLALRVGDIDFNNHTVSVSRSWDREETKTKRARVIPLHPAVLTDLLDAGVASKSELLFGHQLDGTLQSQSTKLTRILRTAMKRAKVGLTGFKLACRRTGCGHVELVKEIDPRRKPRCPKCDMRLWIEPQPRAVRWYDLRHMCATLHHEHGANDLCITIGLGHSLSKKTTTEKKYIHPTMVKMSVELSKWKLARPPKSICQTELPLTCERITR